MVRHEGARRGGAVFVDDYTPMKRIGIEELEGCVNILDRILDEVAEDRTTPMAWMTSGARMALHLMLVGKFRYPQDFVDVFELKCAELYGLGSDPYARG